MKKEKIEMHFRKKVGNSWVKIYENGISEIKFTSRKMLKKLHNVDEFKIIAEIPVEEHIPFEEKQNKFKLLFYPFALLIYPLIILNEKLELFKKK